MNIIKNKLDESDKLITTFKEYYETIKIVLTDRHPEIVKEIKDLLESYPTRTEKLQNYISKEITDIDTIFKFTSEVQEFFIGLNNLKEIFSVQELRVENVTITDISQTFRLETSEFLERLIDQYEQFSKKYKDVDEKLVEELSTLVFDKREEPIRFVEHLQQLYKSQKNTVRLYAKIIQKIIDDLYSSGNAPIMFKIMDMIEEDKNIMLEGFATSTKKDIHLRNPPLQKFGFIPITECMPLPQLIEKLLNKKTKITQNDLPKFARREKCSFIILYHIVPNPVEYRLRQLVFSKPPKQEGLTPQHLELFRTVIPLKSDKWKFDIKIIGDDSDYFVLETFDGKTFRAMSPWFMGKNKLPEFRVKKLINYTKKPYITRASNYHDVMIWQSLSHMFKLKPVDIESLEQESKDIDTSLIRNEIFLRIMEIFNKKISKVRDNNGVNDILHSKEVEEQFTETILKLYTEHKKSSSGMLGDAKFPHYEVFSSYLSDLQKLVRRFTKGLHDTYNRNLLPEDTFSDKTKLLLELRDKLEDTLKQVLEALISPKSNIYQAMYYKNLLLNT